MVDGQEIELIIDRLSYNGGRGVGRLNNFVFFVARTAPGDRVRAKVAQTKSTYGIAELIEVLQPSIHRRIAPCPVVDRCGGCPWQHIEYAEQLRQKDTILRAALKRLPGYDSVQFLPIVAAPSEFRYRNRIQVHIQNGRVGFLAKGSRELVPTMDCLIAETDIAQMIASLEREATDSSELERFEIGRTRAGGVAIEKNRIDPKQALFTQINSEQNRFLTDLVSRWTGLVGDNASILDLYCGAGNFALHLKARYPQSRILGIELSQRAIIEAQRVEQGRFSHPNIQWHAGPASDLMKFPAYLPPSTLILDPPRPGCDSKTVNAIMRSGAKQIIYISCNPMTFARDAQSLLSNGNYRLETIQGIDMFPQTEHIELAARFLLRGK